MNNSVLLTIASVVGIGVGQILFKIASSKINSANLIGSIAFNIPLLAALIIYGFSTLIWIIALRGAPLSKLYPLFALAFIFVPVLESIVFKSDLRTSSLLGGGVIVLGVWIALKG